MKFIIFTALFMFLTASGFSQEPKSTDSNINPELKSSVEELINEHLRDKKHENESSESQAIMPGVAPAFHDSALQSAIERHINRIQSYPHLSLRILKPDTSAFYPTPVIKPDPTQNNSLLIVPAD